LVGLLAACGQDQDRHAALLLAQRAQHAEPVQLGQHQVEDHELRLRALGGLEAAPAVLAHLDREALDLQVVAQAVGEVAVVLDQQDPRHAGSSTTKRAPPAAPSSTKTRPPWRSTRSATTASPMPVPATALA